MYKYTIKGQTKCTHRWIKVESSSTITNIQNLDWSFIYKTISFGPVQPILMQMGLASWSAIRTTGWTKLISADTASQIMCVTDIQFM